MSSHPATIVLCPLHIERTVLQRCSALSACDFHCCGPSSTGVIRWFEQHTPTGRDIVLAGVAGAARQGLDVGTAYIISRVIAEDARQWTPTWPVESTFPGLPTAMMTSTDTTILSPAAKQALGHERGVDLIDQESVAFADAAEQVKARWLIVRGVSDDATQSLPDGIETWVDTFGRTKISRVGAALIRRPQLIRDLIRLQRATKAALTAVGGVLEHVVGTERQSLQNH